MGKTKVSDSLSPLRPDRLQQGVLTCESCLLLVVLVAAVSSGSLEVNSSWFAALNSDAQTNFHCLEAKQCLGSS